MLRERDRIAALLASRGKPPASSTSRSGSRFGADDLRSAQLAAVASVLAGDDKGVTEADPRWTPALAEARAVVARLRDLAGRIGDLHAERCRIAAAADRAIEKLPDGPFVPLLIAAHMIVRRDRDDARELAERVRTLVRAYCDGDEVEGAPSASRTLRQIAALLGASTGATLEVDDKEAAR